MRFSFTLLFALLALSGFAQTPPPATVEGTVVAVVLDHVQLKAADGTVQVVVLPAGVSVTRRVLVPWTNIHEGDWVGIDSKPGADGSQESVAINVFSPGIIAKVRKGQFKMASGDLMTNAPVAKVSVGADGNSVTLKNEGAMVAFRIGDKTIVHRLLDASASDLKPSVKVQVRGTANQDGSIQAANVGILES
jgi:hypothetical protein